MAANSTNRTYLSLSFCRGNAQNARFHRDATLPLLVCAYIWYLEPNMMAKNALQH